MWTRGNLACNRADAIRPWHQNLSNTERGRLAGNYPGYGAGLIRGGYQAIEPGLDRGGQVYPGFGIAMDPSDPSTWSRPVRFT